MGVSSVLPAQLSQSIYYGLLAINVTLLLYTSILVVYRLFLHPFRKIPGPWLAAATSWYEFYQDVVLVGNYVKEYPSLHARYGQPNISRAKGSLY